MIFIGGDISFEGNNFAVSYRSRMDEIFVLKGIILQCLTVVGGLENSMRRRRRVSDVGEYRTMVSGG